MKINSLKESKEYLFLKNTLKSINLTSLVNFTTKVYNIAISAVDHVFSNRLAKNKC